MYFMFNSFPVGVSRPQQASYNRGDLYWLALADLGVAYEKGLDPLWGRSFVGFSPPEFNHIILPSTSTSSLLNEHTIPRRKTIYLINSKRNGGPPQTVSLHVSLSQQDLSGHSSFSLHHHSACVSGWRDHVKSPSPCPSMPCNGKGNGCSKRKD